MTNKQQDQAHAQMLKLKDIPRSMSKASQLVDSFLMNFNFETMTKSEHETTIDALEEMLVKYRKIRGR